MRANSFIDWLKGFITNKLTLSEEELKLLLTELQSVKKEEAEYSPVSPRNPVPNPIIDWDKLQPFGTEYGCKYPDNCGMPTVWHGVVPPICHKCGKQGQMMEIRCDKGSGESLPDLPITTSGTNIQHGNLNTGGKS